MTTVHTADAVRKSPQDRIRPGRIRPEIRARLRRCGKGVDFLVLLGDAQSWAEHLYLVRAWQRHARRAWGTFAEWCAPGLPGVDLSEGERCPRCRRYSAQWDRGHGCPTCAQAIELGLEVLLHKREPETEDDARRRAAAEGAR